MNKAEILNILDEVHVVKLDGKDSIAFSPKFVVFLESVTEMFTKADLEAILKELDLRIDEIEVPKATTFERTYWNSGADAMREKIKCLIQEKINSLKAESENP